jgi:hypothetical protein
MMWANFRPPDSSRGWKVVGEYDACPVCDRPAFYHRGMDRLFHCDGRCNVECWLALSRGEPTRADLLTARLGLPRRAPSPAGPSAR